MKLTRRMMLKGLGGATLALPLLESFSPRHASAQDMADQRFAVFFRQANGVAARQSVEGGSGFEPERFWPAQYGALTPQTMAGLALEELVDHRDQLLVVDHVNNEWFDYGDGHANGCMQGLTAAPPLVANQGGSSEAGGQSIDHRIGAELNDNGNDSLFLYVGRGGGWLGGPSISYRGPGQRHSAHRDPRAAYQQIAGVAGMSAQNSQRLADRQASINDLVRAQMGRLLSHPRLSQGDRDRLDLHLSAVRDLEVTLGCVFDDARVAALDGATSIIDSTDGNDIHTVARLQMDVTALAIACGYTRSVAIQVGAGNDGHSQFRDDNGNLMENYHYISHRRSSHDSAGALIQNADLLHHQIDRQFAGMFKYLLDRLSEYQMPDGQPLLQHGVAAWYNDNGNGPGHSAKRIPWVLAGGAGGFLKRGECVDTGDGDTTNNYRMLNTLGSAVGMRNSDGSLFDRFASEHHGGNTGLLDAIIA